MKIKAFLAATALALLLPTGCATSDQGSVAQPRSDVRAEPATTAWPAFAERYIEGYFRLNPAFAVSQGRHEYDGQLPDWSADGLRAQTAYLKTMLVEARAFDPATLSEAQRFERAYLIAQAQGRLFFLEDADEPHRNPAFYLDNGLDPNVYIARPYAAPEQRMRAFITYANNVPIAVAQIRANLRTPLPVSFIDYGKAGFGGLADYFKTDAKAAFASVKDPALQAEFDRAAAGASAAMKDLADWLESGRAQATQDFALGPDRFARMVRMTELVDVPLDELEAVGWADLKRNQAALRDACARFAPGATIKACIAKVSANKPEGGAVAAARAQLTRLKAFIIDKNLVSIPGTEEALVEEAPPYNRQNFAYIDIPGPYEKGLPSVYYIAPPDPSWPADVQRAYLPSKASLLFTSAHEVWPGHFLNFLHANRAASLFGRVFVGYAFAEGWAHYTEEMMWDAGLGNGDPETHIGQLLNALLRDVRFLSAIGLHTRGMTMEQSRRMFLDEAYQDEGNARQQAARGTYDPAYLNYTMGKLMIRKLREDWTASRGGRAAWHDFHDQFLSYGGPPIPLVRQAMMGGEAKAVF